MEALPGKVASASAFASERNRGAAANAAANTHSVTEPNTYGAPFNISAKWLKSIEMVSCDLH